MLPWEAELARPNRSARASASELLRANPLGDPYGAPVVGLPPARVRRRPRPPGTPRSRYPGLHRARRRCGPTGRRTASRSPRRPMPVFASGGGTRAASSSIVDAWTAVRRLAVRRLAGERRLPLLPLRRGRAVGGRALPDGRGSGARGRSRQVVAAGSAHDHSDAPARTCSARWPPTPAIPCTSSPTCPDFGRAAGICASTTTTSTGGGRTSAPARPSPRKPTRRCCIAARGSRLLLGPRGRHTRAAFDPRTGGLRPRGVAALARLGPGSHGRRRTPTRSARCGAVWIDAGTRDEWYLDLGAAGIPR